MSLLHLAKKVYKLEKGDRKTIFTFVVSDCKEDSSNSLRLVVFCIFKTIKILLFSHLLTKDLLKFF